MGRSGALEDGAAVVLDDAAGGDAAGGDAAGGGGGGGGGAAAEEAGTAGGKAAGIEAAGATGTAGTTGGATGGGFCAAAKTEAVRPSTAMTLLLRCMVNYNSSNSTRLEHKLCVAGKTGRSTLCLSQSSHIVSISLD
jgi:hypothetical protein